MAKIEIEESELANLQRVNSVAALIGKNPKARALLQEAVAIAAPDEAGSEHAIRREFSEQFSGVTKKIDDFIEAQNKEREERKADEARRELEGRWARGRAELREAGYNDEGIASVEKLMEQEGVPSHKAAAALHEKLHPPPEPVVAGGSRWNWFDRNAEAENDTAYNALMNGDDEGWLARSIPAALKEVRGG
jgi:hypothetical protein